MSNDGATPVSGEPAAKVSKLVWKLKHKALSWSKPDVTVEDGGLELGELIPYNDYILDTYPKNDKDG